MGSGELQRGQNKTVHIIIIVKLSIDLASCPCRNFAK
eukprot:SAG11_NODE_32697_length_281_cov_1.335165_2_plen_36_part_01